MKGEGDGLKQFVNGARPGLSRSKREYLQVRRGGSGSLCS